MQELPLFKFKHCMVDIETLSKRHNAAIVSIGAAKFTFQQGILETFKVNISAEDCKKNGLSITKDTMDWWGTQSKQARMGWMSNPVSLEEGLNQFVDWWGTNKHQMFWCQGLSFDPVIINNALSLFGKEKPWKYYVENDLRTVYNLLGVDNRKLRENDKEGVYHDALDDAVAQAKNLISLFT